MSRPGGLLQDGDAVAGFRARQKGQCVILHRVVGNQRSLVGLSIMMRYPEHHQTSLSSSAAGSSFPALERLSARTQYRCPPERRLLCGDFRLLVFFCSVAGDTALSDAQCPSRPSLAPSAREFDKSMFRLPPVDQRNESFGIMLPDKLLGCLVVDSMSLHSSQ